MKKQDINSKLKLIITATLTACMVFAFCACGGDDEETGNTESSANSTFNTKASTEVASDYETVVYKYEDFEIPEDLYSSTVTMEYDGDTVMAVTEVMVDDMSAEDDEDLIQMHLEDYDGNLDETGFKDAEGFTWSVDVDDKVRTETKKFDFTKFDIAAYKAYVGLEDESDTVSLEALTKIYEEAGYTKAE